MALKIMRARDPYTPDLFLSQMWVYRFRKRHPEIAAFRARKIDAMRYQGLNVTDVKEYFDALT